MAYEIPADTYFFIFIGYWACRNGYPKWESCVRSRWCRIDKLHKKTSYMNALAHTFHTMQPGLPAEFITLAAAGSNP